MPISTCTNVTAKAAKKPTKNSAVVVPLVQGDDVATFAGDAAMLPEEIREAVSSLVADGSAAGKVGEVATLVADGRRVLAVGVGKAATVEATHKFAAAAGRAVKKYKLTKVALLPPAEDLAEATVTGFMVGHYDNRNHKGTATLTEPAPAVALEVLTGDKVGVSRGESIGLAQNYARTIAFRPGNDIAPPSLAKEAESMAKTLGLSCRVIDEKEAKKLGMGGLLAVGSGSATPPRMIVLGHKLDVSIGKKKGKKSRKSGEAPLLAIGKAITFDTGGISIKSAPGMQEMVFDKCGGMAVLGFMAACAMLDLDCPVVGILAAAENMPSGTAYRPGDILTMHNGVTVEVTNTDAEGRLVLADALSWGIDEYKPSACVDLATLTGAAVVALGTERAGAWSNDDALWADLDAASKATGERLWRMPLGDEYRAALASNVADVVNAPGRWGGCDTAAEFLHHFVPGNVAGGDEVPWCHLDIAPTGYAEKDGLPYVRGATGFGVRTLVAWAMAKRD